MFESVLVEYSSRYMIFDCPVALLTVLTSWVWREAVVSTVSRCSVTAAVRVERRAGGTRSNELTVNGVARMATAENHHGFETKIVSNIRNRGFFFFPCSDRT